MIAMDLNNDELEASLCKLQNRKEVLEAKLLDKCNELKKLCFAEAELTGTFPIETPIESDESPPKIRRRIGTMFPFTDEVIKELSNSNVLGVTPLPPRNSPKRKIPWGRTLSLSQPTKLTSGELSVTTSQQQSQQQRHTWASGQPTTRTRFLKSKFNVAKKW
ncbi:uncharacterized protein [Rhodnius prolixus]|uniref:uncharacterized protein n=1 Tax=Rhodnius prolixus TaxID=13249 RepID=UPI003D18D7DE